MATARMEVTLSTEDHRWLLQELVSSWLTAQRRDWIGDERKRRPWPREEYRLAYEALARRPVPSAERIAELRALFQQSLKGINEASEPMRRYYEAEAEIANSMVEPAVILQRSTFELDRHVCGMLVDWLDETWREFERRCANPSSDEIDRLHEHYDRVMRDTSARLIMLLTGGPRALARDPIEEGPPVTRAQEGVSEDNGPAPLGPTGAGQGGGDRPGGRRDGADRRIFDR
jgi:hypothetical protein